MGGKRWTEEEIEILKKYRREGSVKLSRRLPHRTPESIKLKINKLGIGIQSLTESDKEYILDNYLEYSPTKIAHNLNYSDGRIISNFLSSQGLRRKTNNWIRQNIESGINEDGYFVKIYYEMSDKVD